VKPGQWIKPSGSNGSGGNNCVEVFKVGKTGEHFVRDSKNLAGPLLSFTDKEWALFVQAVKAGEFG
jgi:hypothetical protein